MSISDHLMWRYLELLSFRPMNEIQRWREEVAQGANPRDVKIRLAEELVERFHGVAAARKAHEAFVARFRHGALPEQIPEVELAATPEGMPIANLLKDAGLTASTSEALRMIKQGAVRIDGERVEDRALLVPAGSEHIFQVGKRRFARVRLEGTGAAKGA